MTSRSLRPPDDVAARKLGVIRIDLDALTNPQVEQLSDAEFRAVVHLWSWFACYSDDDGEVPREWLEGFSFGSTNSGEASDALAALFSSSWLWESSLARRGGSDHLTIEQVIRAWWALSLIAENGGESVTFAQNRPPRGGISDSFSENDLRHLHDLGLITFQKAGGRFTLGRGPRLEELRRTFAEEFER